MELKITMISAMLPQANGGRLLVSLSGDQSCLDVECHLVVLLSGDGSNRKQRIPLHKDGSTDASLGLTFLLRVDDAVASSGRLKFKIKNAKRTFCIHKDVGEVDVPVTDLLMNSGDSDVKPKNLSYDVKSSSGEKKGVLEFSCKLVPLPAKKAGEPFTGYPAATVPPASNSAVAHPPPMPMGAPPPVAYPSLGYPPANLPQATLGFPAATAPPASNSAVAHPPPMPMGGPPAVAYPSVGYPPANLPQATLGFPAATAPPASNLAVAHPPPMPMGAPPPVANPSVGYHSANLPQATLGFPPHAAPNHDYPAPYPQTANLLNAVPPHGYPPPAVYGHTAPRPHRGRNLLGRVIEVARVAALWKVLGSGNDDDGISPDAGF